MPAIFPYPTDPIQTSLKREGLMVTANSALAIAADLQASIAALDHTPAESLTWEQTFGAFDRLHFALSEAADIASLFSMVHPDGLLREEARSIEPKVDAFVSNLLMDDSVYRVLKRAESSLKHLTNDQQKMIRDTLRDYRRNGLELASREREQLKKLNEELTILGQTFEKNIAETKASIQISPEQLAGLPEQYIASHQPNEEGIVTITCDPPDLIPFMRYADDRQAALELFIKNENKAAVLNLPILDKLIALRKKKAVLLGYATWADYVLEERMAKTPKTVLSFLDTLHKGLQPIRDQEVDLLRKAAGQNEINEVDAPYFGEKVRSNEYGLDSKLLSEYFEVESVERGILDITSSLYGVTFRKANAPDWHEDVRAYDILDPNNLPIARFYLDLYPRDNKYKHAAMFTLRPTMKKDDGMRVMPILALVCNFPKPGEQPALLEHSQVTTFFHEFGHCLHLALSKTDLATFSGTNTTRDFVEAPSQLFEEWAWDRDVLNRFARHYETGDVIPQDLFTAMQRARHFGQAIGTDRQILYANLDLAYHMNERVDTDAVLEDLSRIYSPFTRVPDTHFQSHFGHLVGYDASYYGYQWALSISKDLFTRFQASGIMNPDTAQAYLKAILERGGSDDEEQLVEAFLGRPSSPEAYLKFLGIS